MAKSIIADKKTLEEIKTFKVLALCEELVEACDEISWRTPTKIQADAMPHGLGGYKCAPVFFALVLSQTRFRIRGSGFGLKCAVLVGGVDLMQQQIALGKQPHIIVGTPGRLMDHLTNTKGFSLSMLKYLVKKLQRACLTNPVKIEAAQKYSTVDTLKQHFRFVAAKNKDCFHVYILIQMSGCTSMDRNVKAVFISGQMTQANRLETLNKFKSGQGLDIPSVDMVVNYDIPTNPKVHIHQVGRTARAGRSGLAISLVNQYELEEEVMQYYEEVADSRRKAQTKLKEMRGTRRRRGRDDSDDVGRYLTSKG
ncbi:hypothetical protein ES319_D11G028000v1 [Gossypium barbadense]|uniref:Helicase C-terminal domain-containing protein n=1 Tax=Gossypium barbadense TaxID=3634 RepID=A0A5J5PA27_GOSBA|nr:hypothetical protein ES319_D11G028000v1 [Gossypium barbadense]